MELALTVAFSLSASLIIALTLVPALASKILKEKTNFKKSDENSKMEKFNRFYGKTLNKAIRFREAFIASAFILFLLYLYLTLFWLEKLTQ